MLSNKWIILPYFVNNLFSRKIAQIVSCFIYHVRKLILLAEPKIRADVNWFDGFRRNSVVRCCAEQSRAVKANELIWKTLPRPYYVLPDLARPSNKNGKHVPYLLIMNAQHKGSFGSLAHRMSFGFLSKNTRKRKIYFNQRENVHCRASPWLHYKHQHIHHVPGTLEKWSTKY